LSSRVPSRSPAPAGGRGGVRRSTGAVKALSFQRWQIVVAAVTLVLVVWWLWPSGLRGVKNLDSSGSAIIAFGDSLTAGYGAAETEAYPAQLSRTSGLTVGNAGVSGDTTESALARIDKVLSQQPRIAIVGLGGNDFLRSVPIASTESNLRTIVKRLQGAGAMVVVLGFQFPSLSANYEKMYERVAEEEGCLLIGDVLDGILSDPKLKSDEIHPNAKGYGVLAERVEQPLKALIKKADASR